MRAVDGLNPQIETAEARLLGLYRSATPTQKLAVVGRINASLQALKAAKVRADHPGLTPHEQNRLVRSWWFSARD
jgi:hypothetical protein